MFEKRRIFAVESPRKTAGAPLGIQSEKDPWYSLPSPPYLKVSVNDKVGLKIIIILSERVDQLLCHLGEGGGGGVRL